MLAFIFYLPAKDWPSGESFHALHVPSVTSARETLIY